MYRFTVDGEEWVTIGLRGHILEPDFTPQLVYKKRGGWKGGTAEGESLAAEVADSLPSSRGKKKEAITVEQTDGGAAFYQTANLDRHREAGVSGGGLLFRLCASADEGFRGLPAYEYLGRSESAGLHFT